MRLSEVIITLLAMAGVPLLALYLYELIYNYVEEENDEVPLDEEEEKGAD
jgi:hypothetical protein